MSEGVSGEETKGAASPIKPNHAELVKDGKNSLTLQCERCGCVVLRPGSAKFVQKELFLPHMKKKAEGTDPNGETLSDCWLVDDMYTFDNVGFTKNVGTSKYLICADCEIGPIGWHDVNIKNEFYVALDRVKHV
ncbi:guanine nucleotide exchange factor MSS4 [Lingula anatina]|uniref:Guanine nucleotide exchange factor MSS4 n=1 Tax=Lingula anatina TaxID=7574 RepID=A0A1S3JKA3_LINAN|nr:guanine nucleotide exchange factor MSS4-like [Lingula anatina]XP_013410850.1 guanine nucleotide exchange factor MSS4 [Lingula anatina]|eukprot:XP_013393132.1 guanine nucleotide exchange factor MSS4-like [Lingula anatina]